MVLVLWLSSALERKTVMEPVTSDYLPSDPDRPTVGKYRIVDKTRHGSHEFSSEWSFSDLSTGDAMSESGEKNGSEDSAPPRQLETKAIDQKRLAGNPPGDLLIGI